MNQLRFNHPVSHILSFKGLKESYLYKLCYKYIGTTSVDDTAHKKIDYFVNTTQGIIYILKNTGEYMDLNNEDFIFKIIEAYFFNELNDETYKFIIDKNIRNKLLADLANKKNIEISGFKYLIHS
jgi:hypothetical protein